MDKKELKQKLKNPDFKEGYRAAESVWRERMNAAVSKEKSKLREYGDAVFNLFNEVVELKRQLKEHNRT